MKRMLQPLLFWSLLMAPTEVLNAQVTLPTGLTERDISVTGGPVALPGTLTLPAGKGPFPGIILVHGSGPGDRDETIGGNKTFRDVAWGLAERGIVVLRYDKRAMVQPMWYANRAFTVYDEVTQDALNALVLLRSQPEVDALHTFLLGHSLGGVLAPRLAQADGKLAGIILMAGATNVKLADQMERQIAYLVSITPDSLKALAQAQVAPILEAVAKIRALTPADSANETPIPGLGGTGPKYWLDLNAYDPAATMRALTIPALVLQGMRDYQVPPDQLEDWLTAVGPKSNLTVKRYPALTHLFMPGEGPPNPQEYAVAKRVDPQVMSDIAAWIKMNK